MFTAWRPTVETRPFLFRPAAHSNEMPPRVDKKWDLHCRPMESQQNCTLICVCVYKQDINTKSERVSIILSYIIYVHTHVYIAVYWLVPQRPNN